MVVPGHPVQLVTWQGGYTHWLRYVFDNFDSFHNQQPHKQTEHGKRHSDSDLYKSCDLLAILHHAAAARWFSPDGSVRTRIVAVKTRQLIKHKVTLMFRGDLCSMKVWLAVCVPVFPQCERNHTKHGLFLGSMVGYVGIVKHQATGKLITIHQRVNINSYCGWGTWKWHWTKEVFNV